MKQLVLFPTGSLSPKDKERLSKEGYVAIEAEDPSKVILPIPSGEMISGDTLVMSLLHGISNEGGYSYAKSAFFKEFHKRVLAKEASK